MKPMVSIIVPAYKAADHIARCIRSIQSQTYTNWELIIVCAPEEGNKTFNVVSEYAKRDNRIVPALEGTKTNCATARNIGIVMAHGSFISFNDADDEWTSWKLEEQMELAVFNPWVSSWFAVFADGDMQHICKKSQAIQTYLLKREVIDGLIKDDGYVFNPELNAQDDLDFILRLWKRHQQVVVESITVFYYPTSDGITLSTGKLKHLLSQWRIVFANRSYRCIPWLVKITVLTPLMVLKRGII